MVYECLLLIAVLALAQVLAMLATFNGQTLLLLTLQHCFVFMVMAAYFIHFWTHSGHTLAMKTWRIKVIKPGHARLPLRTAALRFMLAWGWCLPALLVCGVAGLKSPQQIGIALLTGLVLWTLTAFLDTDRQFLHDKLAGTRLIRLPKAPKTAKKTSAAPAAGA